MGDKVVFCNSSGGSGHTGGGWVKLGLCVLVM